MKKRALILALCLLISFVLGGCGQKPNPDHEYIVSLLEKGEYDMAIDIIEHLKARESGSAQPADNKENTTSKVETPTETPTEKPISVSTGLSGIDEAQILELVERFMKEQGNDVQMQYKELSGNKPGPISLLNVAEYFLEDTDGNGTPGHFILMNIGGTFASIDAVFDAVQVAYDIDRGTFINSTNIDWNCIGSGDITTVEQFHNMLANAYYSYLCYGSEILWTERETVENLDAEAISRINEKLN